MDLPGLGALAMVTGEWLALGALIGIDWPTVEEPFWAPRWALRLLTGAVLTAVTLLGLALVGVGFGSIPLSLLTAAVVAGAIRLSIPRHPRSTTVQGSSPGPARSDEHHPSDQQPRTSDEQPPHTSNQPMRRSDQPPPSTDQQPPRSSDQRPMDARERAGWLLLGAVLLAATFRSLVVPEAGWDAFSHWGLRAQAFALARTIVDAHSEHEYYPPLVPLLEAWLALHRGGTVSIDLVKTVWAILGSAFAVCLSWHLSLTLRPSWPAPFVGTLILASTPELLENFWTGQADLALTAFLTLTTLALLQAQRSSSHAWLWQAAIFAAAAALTKFEGAPRLAVVLAALVVDAALTRRWPAQPLQPMSRVSGSLGRLSGSLGRVSGSLGRVSGSLGRVSGSLGRVSGSLGRLSSPLGRLSSPFLSVLVVLGATCSASLLWLTVEATHGIAANGEHLAQLQPLALGSVLISLAAVLSGVRTGGGVLVVVLAWAVAPRHLFSSPLRLLSLVALGQLAATLLAFLLSDTAPDIAVRTSATRLFEHFLPVALFVGAVGLACQVAQRRAERDL